jgi:hypothetical protein
VLLLAVVFVLAGVAGIWWRAGTPAAENVARPAIDLNSAHDLQDILANLVLPGVVPGKAVDAERDDLPALPPDECLVQGKNADDLEAVTPVEQTYTMPDDGSAVVRLGRIRGDRSDDVARMIRSTKPFCVQEADSDGSPARTTWTRVAATGFGLDSVTFRTATTADGTRGPVLNTADTVVYVMSGRWLVRVQMTLGGDPATDRVIPALLGRLDSALHTALAVSRPRGSGCGPVPGPPVLTPREHDTVTLIHDSACRRAADDLLPLMLGRFVDDGGPGTPEAALRRATPQVFDTVVAALEHPPIRKHGALTFRAGNAAVLFDMVGSFRGLSWTGLVTRCGTPEQPGNACSPDRNGPLGDTAWENALQGLGCESGGPGVELDAVHYADITGDGTPEAIVAGSCIPETGSSPQSLSVYGESSGRLVLIARLLGAQDGTDSRGLRVEYADFSSSVLSVVSAGYRDDDATAFPGLVVTDQFAWNGTAFVRGPRSVRPRQG